jgi:hypothetical protein
MQLFCPPAPKQTLKQMKEAWCCMSIADDGRRNTNKNE